MALPDAYRETMRPLLDTIDNLRKIGVADEGVKLPTIVVIGDQSSGKSSVIERLSGVSLPRGKGIVTRVPLVMSIKSSKSVQEPEIEIEYGGKRDRITHDEVEDAVREATQILAGHEKGVCLKPINLHVSGPDLPDLTLVDLPGITRVPIKGQPQDIYQQVVNMIREQIKPEETVILNVISAEIDWATCESFNLSKEVDQEGARTLAVVTKVDRNPEGAFEKVLANDVNVGLGYVLVCNRPTDEASEASQGSSEFENDVLFKHSKLKTLDADMLGCGALGKILTAIQEKRVIGSLPKIRSQLNSKLAEKQSALEKLAPSVATEAEAMIEFLRIMSERTRLMEGLMLRGERHINVETDEGMLYPSKLHSMFEELEESLRGAASKFFSSDYKEKVKTETASSSGIALANFLSHPVFKELLYDEVRKCRPICLETLDAVTEYTAKASDTIIDVCAAAMPNLAAVMKELSRQGLANSKQVARAYIEREIRKSREVICTYNHYYMDTVGKAKRTLENWTNHKCYICGKKPSPSKYLGSKWYCPDGHGNEPLQPLEGDAEQLSLIGQSVDNTSQALQYMQISVYAYWKVNHKLLIDNIPKEIRLCMEEAVLHDMDKVLRQRFGADASDLLRVMKEDPKTTRTRGALVASIRKLEKGLNLLDSVAPRF